MRKDIFKRILSVIMAVILCTCMLGGFPAFAARRTGRELPVGIPAQGRCKLQRQMGPREAQTYERLVFG